MLNGFLILLESIPVIDVRSPSEFSMGHIPGAINIPLFNDKERETVGIKYKNEGRIPAIIEGLELIGPSMSAKLGSGSENFNKTVNFLFIAGGEG